MAARSGAATGVVLSWLLVDALVAGVAASSALATECCVGALAGDPVRGVGKTTEPSGVRMAIPVETAASPGDSQRETVGATGAVDIDRAGTEV